MQPLIQAILAAVFLAVAVFSEAAPQAPRAVVVVVYREMCCNFFCCEFNPGTGGTLCKNNTAIPHPYADDCSRLPIRNQPNGDGNATAVCCANPNCANQPGFARPITNV